MLRQIRMNKWREDAPSEEIQAVVAALPRLGEQIPEVRGWWQAESKFRHDGDDFDFVLIVEFDDEAAYRRYLAHPLHASFVAERVRPLLERTVRIRCEYDG